MKELPQGGILAKLIRTGRNIGRLRIGVHAANTSYFLILAVFPTLVLLLGLLRYTRFDAADLITFVEGFIPSALLPEAEVLITGLYDSTSRTMVGLSAVTALWSASRGVFGLLTGLNAIYEVPESRGYFYTRAISLFYTFAFILVLLLTLVLHVFGTGLLDFLQHSTDGFFRFLLRVIDLRFFFLLALQTALFTAMFMALPNRKNRLGDSLPGAFLASSGWLIFSHLFSIYVENFSNYANLYGSVYAVALTMLWLYFCILIVFYGGLLNRLLSKR